LFSRDGSDGPWASFYINTGGDGQGQGQNIRTLPGLSFSILLLPLAQEDCDGARSRDPSCDPSQTYQRNSSVSETIGDLDILTVVGLSRFRTRDGGPSQAAWYGLDNIGLGTADPQSITILSQVVAGTSSKDFNIGLFGLSNKALNLGGALRQPFLARLRMANVTNGTGFSYTAGSVGRDAVWYLPRQREALARNSTLPSLGSSLTRDSTPPSLVLGGYDASRVDTKSTLQVDIASNSALSATYPFYVNLTSMTFSNSVKQWQNGSVDSLGSVAIYIDSAVPQLWLPLSACAVFEQVFGLEWNETAQLYLINSTQHERLLQLNTSVTFSLHSSRDSSTVRNFTLPYAAFDLRVTYPLVDTESYYFPLKRASNPDQYMLGRTFLQETHISVDYDAAYFNISQAVFNHGNQKLEYFMVPQKSANHTIESYDGAHGRLSKGAYAGLGVSLGMAALIVASILFLRSKRWWPFKTPSNLNDENEGNYPYMKGELHGEAIARSEASGKERLELEARGPLPEVQGPDTLPHEIGSLALIQELDTGSSLWTNRGDT
jgi:hypothetical protein